MTELTQGICNVQEHAQTQSRVSRHKPKHTIQCVSFVYNYFNSKRFKKRRIVVYRIFFFVISFDFFCFSCVEFCLLITCNFQVLPICFRNIYWNSVYFRYMYTSSNYKKKASQKQLRKNPNETHVKPHQPH